MCQFRYLGTTITNQTLIEEEVERRLKYGDACCHLVHNLLPSHLLSENIKIRIYQTIILTVVLYGCESLFLALREEHRLLVFVIRVPRKMFGPKRDDMMGVSGKLHNRELCDLCSSPSIIRIIKSRRMRWVGM
jgi:hypothetical protein